MNTETKNGHADGAWTPAKTKGKSGPIRRTRKLFKQTPGVSLDTIMSALIRGPEDVHAAATREASARLELEGHVTALSIRALSEALFPGKTSGDDRRVASNDQERKLAVDTSCHDDQLYIELRQAHEAAQRDLTLCRDRLKSAQLAARLIIRG